MPDVFISYCQTPPEHTARVEAFAKRLQKEAGVNVIFDLFQPAGGPSEGWITWGERQAERSTVVLAVFCDVYSACWEGGHKAGEREGAKNEIVSLHSRLQTAEGNNQGNRFCRALIFQQKHISTLPNRVSKYEYFNTTAEKDYPRLLEWLRSFNTTPNSQDVRMAALAADQVQWPQPVPGYVRKIADRKFEFRHFERMVTGQIQERAFLVHGVSNRGKTTLLNTFHAYAKELSLRTCRINLSRRVLALVATDIAESFPECRAQTDIIALPELRDSLLLLSEPSLLILDTLNEASDEVLRWITDYLLKALENVPALAVVLAGQSHSIPRAIEYAWNAMAYTRELQPIHEEKDWFEYVSLAFPNSPLNAAHIQAIVHALQGDPGQVKGSLQSLAEKLSA